jgi:hypothetical protein
MALASQAVGSYNVNAPFFIGEYIMNQSARYLCWLICVCAFVIYSDEEITVDKNDKATIIKNKYAKLIREKGREVYEASSNYFGFKQQYKDVSKNPTNDIRAKRSNEAKVLGLRIIQDQRAAYKQYCIVAEELCELKAVAKYMEDNPDGWTTVADKDKFLQEYYVKRIIDIEGEKQRYRQISKDNKKRSDWCGDMIYLLCGQASIIKAKMPKNDVNRLDKEREEQKRLTKQQELWSKETMVYALQQRYDELTKEYKTIYDSGNLDNPAHQDWKRFAKLRVMRAKLQASITEEKTALSKLKAKRAKLVINN